MNWTYRDENWILCPPRPVGLIHFLGGAFVATAPQVTYDAFLRGLMAQGYAIVATRYLVQPDHEAIAADVTRSFNLTYQDLCGRKKLTPNLPVFGLGHSLGAKLQLLLACQGNVPRMGNLLIAFNNFDSDRAIPFSEAIKPFIPLDFSPSPAETLATVQSCYQLEQTLILQFQMDTLDDSLQLNAILKQKFPNTFINQTIYGDHLTPLAVNVDQRRQLEQVSVKWLRYQIKLSNKMG
ncbi:MAG: DUF1350 family protein [Cyanobacteria bacterium P01_F01_bin.42]